MLTQSNFLIFSIFSLFGIFTECYFLIRHKVKFKEFLIFLFAIFAIFLICEVMAVITNLDSIHDLSDLFDMLFTYLFFFILFFLIIFYEFYKKIILFTINEAILLFFTTIFWYIILIKYSLNPVFLSLFILPTIAVLFISFSKISLNKIWKLFFYIWFLLIDTFLVIHFILLSHIFTFKNYGNNILQAGFDLFIVSMVLTYLVFNLFSLLYLLPIRTGKQSFKDRFEEIKKHINILTGKYSDYQLKKIYSFIIIISLLAFLYFNYIFNFFSDFILISLIIIISQLFSEQKPQPSKNSRS